MIDTFLAYACLTLDLATALAQQVAPGLGDTLAAVTPSAGGELLIWLLLAIGLSSTLVAGVFQSFSDFVMRGLTLAEPQGGAQSMQMINRTVMRSVFIVLLLGLAPVMLAVSVFNGLGTQPAALWIHAGTGTYVAGVFFVTMLGNVPMNNRLDRMAPAEPDTARYWIHYGRVWTRWNHVRTIGSFAAGVCFVVAALMLAQA